MNGIHRCSAEKLLSVCNIKSLKYRIYTRSAKDNDAESDLNLAKSRDADNETDTSWQQGCEGEKIDCLRETEHLALSF